MREMKASNLLICDKFNNKRFSQDPLTVEELSKRIPLVVNLNIDDPDISEESNAGGCQECF
jgi:hypothetical protein